MNTVEILQMRLEGFGSYAAPTTFKFDSTGLFSVQGKNGAGKSTIFHALTWVFYKVLPDDWSMSTMKSEKHIRPEGYKGTRVQVMFNVNGVKYLIARHADFKGETFGVEGENSLMLFRNKEGGKIEASHMVGDQLYKDDQQGFINSLMGVDAETFKNSIIFGQKMKRLIGADAKEKRELFEQLFDLAFIETAKEKADARAKEINEKITKHAADVLKLNGLIQAEQVAIDSQRKNEADFEQRKADRIEELRGEFNEQKTRRDTYKTQAEEVEAELPALRKLAKPKPGSTAVDPAMTKAQDNVAYTLKKMQGASMLESEAVAKIRPLKDAITSLDGDVAKLENKETSLLADLRDVATTCTVCGAKIKPEKLDEVKARIQKQIDECKKAVTALRHKRGDLVLQHSATTRAHAEAKAETEAAETLYKKACQELSRLREAHAQAQPTNDYAAELARKEERLKSLRSAEEQAQAQMDKLRLKKQEIVASEPAPFNYTEHEAKIESMTCDVDMHGRKITELNEEDKRVSWWAKKGFGSGGLKGYVFAAMLEKLNELVGKYAVHFGYGVVFSVDITKASKPFVTTVYSGDITRPYGQFSGGQKQRIDVCLAFAMHELVGYKTKFNIAVFDEVSDGLDGEGMEMVNNVITEASQDKGVYVVSHNPIFVPQSASTITVTGGLNSPSIITRHND